MLAQIVENQRVDSKVRQQVLSTIGRLDQHQESGHLEGLLVSLAKFSEHAAVLEAVKADRVQPSSTRHVGPALIFEKLWHQAGTPKLLESLLRDRKFEFAVERAVFVTVLHRLMVSGSDRAAEHWCRTQAIQGSEDLHLNHFYRAMAEMLRELEARHLQFILGARLRAVKEIRETVLADQSPAQEVHPPRLKSHDPSPLQVKNVYVDKRRYVACHNEEQAAKDRHDREAILAGLKDQLKQGTKSLVGNKGYRKFLREKTKGSFEIDTAKVESESQFDGTWVLRTNTELNVEDVALKYKDLLVVESLFRNMKSVLDTRPIYHKCDETIRGHVFVSFLALILMKELQICLEERG